MAADLVQSIATTAAAYAREHPVKTTFIATNVALLPFGGVGVLVNGSLDLIGFGYVGPTAGT